MEPFVHDAVLDMQLSRDRLEAVLGGLQQPDWGRVVPFGSRTVRDVLAHLAASDHAWALSAQGLLKGEADSVEPEANLRELRELAIERRRKESIAALRDEMVRRRKLLLSLFDLLEPRHLSQRVAPFGERDSVRERIWVGYHDRLHQADIERALQTNWHSPRLTFVAEITSIVRSLAPDETSYVIYSVDETRWEAACSLRGWSYRNLLAHIATGDWVLQAHLRRVIEAGSVAEWPDVDAGNAERVAARRFSTWQRLTDEYLSMRHETVRLLAQLEPRHLGLAIELPWLPASERSTTLLDYLQRFWRHDHHHCEQLRSAMRHATSARA